MKFLADQFCCIEITLIKQIVKPLVLRTIEIQPAFPGEHLRVPLWFAAILIERKFAEVKFPAWFSYERINEFVFEESSSANFCILPLFFERLFEFYMNLSQHSKELIQIYLKLMNLRERKIRKRFDVYKALEPLTLGPLTMMETQFVKRSLAMVGTDVEKVIYSHIT